jgi:serine/threonine protein kinase
VCCDLLIENGSHHLTLDLKLDNILLDTKSMTVKLCDFGLSEFISRNQLMRDQVGSLSYAAPGVYQ